MRVSVPFAGRQLVGIIINTRPITPEITTYKLKEAHEILDQQASIPESLLSMIIWSSQYYCHPIGECLHTALPVALRKPTKSSDCSNTLTVCKWLRTDKPFIAMPRATQQSKLIRLFEHHPSGIWQETLKLLGYSTAQLRALEKKGYLTSVHLDPLSAQQEKKRPETNTDIQLNPAQQQAVDLLNLQDTSFRTHLLHGVTGSGKTEVYIEAAKQLISQKKQTLILIPEINLTPQTLTRFQNQLDSPIGLIHSGMSEKEKLTMWHLARNGIADVIIGTRSAIFTPFNNLGLIVVDEEHDASFKQNDGFKYSARDLAVKRAQMDKIPAILGSATPSLESLLNARQGKYHYIKLTERAGKGTLPDIHLIDIKSRALEHGCSRPLIKQIKKELQNNHQVIVFQNRRGYSPTLLCNSCGWIALCPNCDARLTLHSRPPQLHCHHCDHKERLTLNCKQCGHTPLSPLGTGTERIETGLAELFPETRIVRIDRDNIKKQQDMKQLITEINESDACILVGTQMLAKGHDFHKVTLVAVIDADSSLFSADFRAFEHSTQLLLQVAGRTGRGSHHGTVLIQTKYPEHPLFQPILNNNYDLAALRELEERKTCLLPPFSKMISIRAESTSQITNFNTLSQLKQQLKESLLPFSENNHTENNCLFSGPLEATMPRKNGILRAYLHIFTHAHQTRQAIQQNLPTLLNKQKAKTKLIIDVDPLEYL
jgi:primosomal protein N' (replication factor Y)